MGVAQSFHKLPDIDELAAYNGKRMPLPSKDGVPEKGAPPKVRQFSVNDNYYTYYL